MKFPSRTASNDNRHHKSSFCYLQRHQCLLSVHPRFSTLSFLSCDADSTPLISYSPLGAWTDSPTDASSQLYSSSSWHLSSTEGSTATVTFNGTGIWFYGAKRPGYGAFTLDIDGQTSSGDASSLEATFQQLLGGASGLSMGSHTAVFTHTGSGPVDLDSIIFQTQIGSDGSSVARDTIDDSDPRLTYSPEGDWGVNDLPDTAVHWTETGGALMRYNFTGDAVSVMGTVAPNHANYTVTVDGQTQTFDGTAGHGVSALRENVTVPTRSSCHLILTDVV
ncbi:hypothetical protein OF83DRAFT_353180 [Amylostereum chailletii]|nr:hypothetical protein OF83DRAFT_353180 [Amylostereum chailletii]